MKYPGKLILFEGGEGSGKTTLIRSLGKILQNELCDVVETEEPRGRVRKILLDPNYPLTHEEELTLFLEGKDGRTDHFSEIIIPALKRGNIVLCDRCSPSTIAYQHYGRGLDLANILIRDAKARQSVDFDLIILLDVNPEIGLKRKKPETRFELEKIEFHNRVRRGYLKQAREDPDGKWVIIDASLPFNMVKTKALKSIMAILRKEKQLA